MGHKIPLDSWAIIERVIRRYPETKVLYEDTVDKIIYNTPKPDGQPRGNFSGNPTEEKVIKLSDPKIERMRREIKAVEKAYEDLNEDHKKVIRARFWADRRRNMPYIWMQATVSYSERQMKRVVFAFIRRVGEMLGEI